MENYKLAMSTLEGKPTASHRKHSNAHRHMWIVGLGGIAVGSVLLLYVPGLKPVSSSIFLFGGFHVLGGLVLLASAYVLAPVRLVQRLHRITGHAAAASNEYRFGWGPGWMNGLAVVSAIAVSAANRAAGHKAEPVALVFLGPSVGRRLRCGEPHHVLIPLA